jgi:hypothetical protein
MNKITILGSGTSTGVPILGCNCKVCQSKEMRNKRFRTSALIELVDQRKILINASPDLCTQESGLIRPAKEAWCKKYLPGHGWSLLPLFFVIKTMVRLPSLITI